MIARTASIHFHAASPAAAPRAAWAWWRFVDRPAAFAHRW
jgi:hypothetical protein